MAFPTKVIPFSEACKTWLNNTYAAKNHNHDTVYSKLGHTHTDVGFKYPDYKNARCITNSWFTIYKTNADGYLRFTADTGQSVGLLTHRISDFDSRINTYTFNGSDYNGYDLGALVKHNGNYYQCIKKFTNSSQVPGSATSYWRQVASHIPVIMHTVTAYSADTVDQGFGSLEIPLKSGTYVACITLNDGRGRTLQTVNPASHTQNSVMWFVPFDGNSPSSLSEVATFSYDSFRFDTVLCTLSGLFRNLKIAKS